MCDFVSVNLINDCNTSGIKQYFHNEKSLDKLLSSVVKARNLELGKLAAYEYDKVL